MLAGMSPLSRYRTLLGDDLLFLSSALTLDIRLPCLKATHRRGWSNRDLLQNARNRSPVKPEARRMNRG